MQKMYTLMQQELSLFFQSANVAKRFVDSEYLVLRQVSGEITLMLRKTFLSCEWRPPMPGQKKIE